MAALLHSGPVSFSFNTNREDEHEDANPLGQAPLAYSVDVARLENPPLRLHRRWRFAGLPAVQRGAGAAEERP
jgi:hypothetical protein